LAPGLEVWTVTALDHLRAYMSDESGRKGTGRMKPGNLTHSRSENELDELSERDSKRQYGIKHHSFLRAFLWCVLNFIVYFVPCFCPS
jgi:hypothetical protein